VPIITKKAKTGHTEGWNWKWLQGRYSTRTFWITKNQHKREKLWIWYG